MKRVGFNYLRKMKVFELRKLDISKMIFTEGKSTKRYNERLPA